MSRPLRPEAGTEYGAAPTAEFAEARSLSAVGSLASFLGVSECRARALLEDPAAYCAEIRRHRPPPETQLRRRWQPGYPSPFPP
jgi:hypothetical protein